MEKCLLKKGLAECFGTFMLVFLAVGTAVMTGANVVATALAFGLVIVAFAYTVGRISGCHINPAVSFGALLDKRMSVKEFFVYIGFQFLGAIAGAALLFGLARMALDYANTGFIWGTNEAPQLWEGYGETLRQVTTVGTLIASFILEMVLTFVFVYVILTVTDKKGDKKVNPKMAGIIIGLTLTLVHLIGINFTGTSVNPARSFGPALMRWLFDPANSTVALEQIWIFILAPLAGAALSVLVYRLFHKRESQELDGNMEA
ncbi:MAG: aquaporin [Firmicutes bacterium]|nr:aquaporin [Bacillota bacterium]